MRPHHRITVGKTIRRLRVAKGWTQEELAGRAKLHPTYIGGIERGERNVSLDNLVKVARALGQSTGSLFVGVQ